MSHRNLALQFIQHFCTGNVDALAPLLADDLRFTGPLLSAARAPRISRVFAPIRRNRVRIGS